MLLSDFIKRPAKQTAKRTPAPKQQKSAPQRRKLPPHLDFLLQRNIAIEDKVAGRITDLLRGVDLFAGAGGFTIGALNAGCDISLAIDLNPDAVQTARRAGHRAERMDVRELDQTEAALFGVEVLIGGPPCQPFSSAGKRGGEYDPREGIKLFVNAIDTVQPRRFVFENVKDFLAPKFKEYRDKIMDELGKRFKHIGVWVLNAKDFGVPQDRVRVFVWGADKPLQPPIPTHGPLAGKPYKTVRQALPGFDAPAILSRMTTARSRSIDLPSPCVTTRGTLYTAARQGLLYGTDRTPGRRMQPAELSALQGFPGTFEFTGNLGSRHLQVGNAVPPALGEAVMGAMLAGVVANRMSPQKVLDALKRENPQAFLLEPRKVLDHALVGVTNVGPNATGSMVAVYDRDRLLDALVDDAVGRDAGGDEREEAWYEAQAYLDNIESGFYDSSKPYPWIRRADPDAEEQYAED